jgi:GTPase SAR1 family protein
MTTPKQLRHDIQTLATHLSQVQQELLGRSGITVANIGKECKRTGGAIGELLKNQQIPNEYKVAVVGRFKVGKSSFVNELLGSKLASEGTNPETAAVTTFRHGLNYQAKIQLINKQKWTELQILYANDPNNTDAYRAQIWESFSLSEKTKDGKSENIFDLAALEKEYVWEQGYVHTLDLPSQTTQVATNEFRRNLKKFTSATSPLHCLVDKIEMTAPAEILDQGVLLIDTPGLDDTERFRVHLTEQVVADVDAVLFLTKSGASYGQSEKEFLLSILRKGTIKQLIIVITQFDETYKKVLDAAEEDDENPETVAECIAREKERIEAAISATLYDLQQDESLSSYQQQLGEVKIAFTSTRLHRDWKSEKPLNFKITNADPGGLEAIKKQLFTLLSTESRLSQTTENIVDGARNSLLDLQSVLENKLYTLRNTQNKEVAEQKLHTFRHEFGQASERFERAIEQKIITLNNKLQHQNNNDYSILELISELAEKSISMCENFDSEKSWQKRRNGGWGEMPMFMIAVANQIFPKVRQLLGNRTKYFAHFAKHFEIELGKLSDESNQVSQKIELGTSVLLDVKGTLSLSLRHSMHDAEKSIDAEEKKVQQLLDNFLTTDVAERITARRKAVANIFGVGTIVRQNEQVKAFYEEIKKLLTQALHVYLNNSSQQFTEILLKKAKAAPRDALDKVTLLLEQAADNILTATTDQLVEMKEAAESEIFCVQEILSQTLKMTERITPVFNKFEDEQKFITISTVESSHKIEISDDSLNWHVRIQCNATTMIKRMNLQDGAIGWPYEKIFQPQFLKGMVRMVLVDPHLTKPHQLRNLQEFLLHIAETAHPKEIEVVTSIALKGSAQSDAVIQTAANDIFKNYGVVLNVRCEPGLHDRYLILDNGVLFKLGRGLDIYKPATGLAAYRSISRRVRATEIDVFEVPGRVLSASVSA